VIREDAGVLDATKLLSRREIRRLPVMSRTGKLVGIISLDDLLMLIGSELSHVASTLASELGCTRV
jgi:CBS domain-containing protein